MVCWQCSRRPATIVFVCVFVRAVLTWSRGASSKCRPQKTALFNEHLPTVIRDDTLLEARVRELQNRLYRSRLLFSSIRHILPFPPRPPTSRWYDGSSRRLGNYISLEYWPVAYSGFCKGGQVEMMKASRARCSVYTYIVLLSPHAHRHGGDISFTVCLSAGFF